MIGDQKNKDDFVVVGTKIPETMAKQLNTICQVLGTTSYDLIQLFLYGFIRHATSPHETSPDMQRLLALLEVDAGWQNAFNLANPGDLTIAQLIMILEQEGRNGFGAVMIDKPWMGMSMRQTENANDILERVIEVTQHGVYRQIRLLGARMGCERFSDIITRMVDDQKTKEDDEAFMREMPGSGDYVDYKGIAPRQPIMNKTKQRHRRGVDTIDRQSMIHFDADDRQMSDMESEGQNQVTEEDAEEARQWLRDNSDFQPHGGEW